MEQTDFMMELLQVHGDVDEKRLTMATQRLEVRDYLSSCFQKSGTWLIESLSASCVLFFLNQVGVFFRDRARDKVVGLYWGVKSSEYSLETWITWVILSEALSNNLWAQFFQVLTYLAYEWITMHVSESSHYKIWARKCSLNSLWIISLVNKRFCKETSHRLSFFLKTVLNFNCQFE